MNIGVIICKLVVGLILLLSCGLANAAGSVAPATWLGWSSTITDDGTAIWGPGAAKLNDGRIFVCYSTSATDVQQDAVIKYKLSIDGGSTDAGWSAAVTLLTPSAGRTYTECEVHVLTSGVIMISFNEQADAGGVGLEHVIKGTVAGDGTISWGSIINATSSFAETFSSGDILGLQNGTLLLPIYDGNSNAAILQSTDAGATWGSQVNVASAQYFNEMALEQEAGGRVHALIRRDTNSTGYWHSYSDDNGATWSAAVQVLSTNQPGRPATSMLANGLFLMFARFTDVASGYTFGTGYGLSRDNMATWTIPQVFGTDLFYHYASSAVIGNGTVGYAIARQKSGNASTLVYQQILPPP